MHKLSLVLLSSMFLFSCSTEQEVQPSETKDTVAEAPHVVGNDADEHGCKASAGYTFSHLRNDCVRLFETGIRMNPKKAGLDSTVSSFVILADKISVPDAELFVPGQKESILLKSTAENTWIGGSSPEYLLVKKGAQYDLMNAANRELLYQSN